MEKVILLSSDKYHWYKAKRRLYSVRGFEKCPLFLTIPVMEDTPEVRKLVKRKRYDVLYLNGEGWSGGKIKSNKCLLEHWRKKAEKFLG